MAEFCSCGSMVIDGSCTNKNCINRSTAKVRKTAAKPALSTKSASPVRTKKSSKVTTYNMYDLDKAEE